jgi:hypothetical protein
MHHAGVGEYSGLGRPNAAYLIKAKIRGKKSDSPINGFDIFRVGQGGSTPDEPTMKYRVGVQEDTAISVAPVTMGLDDDPGEPFKVEMKSIRKELERLETVFVAANENEMWQILAAFVIELQLFATLPSLYTPHQRLFSWF